MSLRRVLAGGIAQESHSFNPVPTTRESFAVTEGEDAVARARGTNSTLGGIVDAAAEAGVEVVVPTLFRAQSGGPVEGGFRWSSQHRGGGWLQWLVDGIRTELCVRSVPRRAARG